MKKKNFTVHIIREIDDHFLECETVDEDGNKYSSIGKKSEHSEESKIFRLLKTPLISAIPTLFKGITNNYHDYIIMENLKAGFISPCLADFKLGYRTWDVGTSVHRASRLYNKVLQK